MKFTDFRVEKPPDEGWYIWRLQGKFLPDITLVFLDKFRKRGAGYIDVISPGFDYWDGYRVLLPNGPIEWALYGGEPPKTGYELLEVVGTDNLPCPFCGEKPTWRYSGRYIGAGPIDTDYYYLECCHWFDGFRSRMKNPLELAEKRNEAIVKHRIG